MNIILSYVTLNTKKKTMSHMDVVKCADERLDFQTTHLGLSFVRWLACCCFNGFSQPCLNHCGVIDGSFKKPRKLGCTPSIA